jgi:hypothetical protein
MADPSPIISPTNIQQFTNPNQMADMLMTNLMWSKMGNMLDTNFELTIPNILKILALLSAGEIKNFIISGLTFFVHTIRDMPGIIIGLVMYMSKLFKKPKTLEYEQTPYMPPTNLINIEVEPNFLLLMGNYILKNDNCTYKTTITDAFIKNTKENLMYVKLNNVVIKFDTFTLDLNEQITCTKNIYTNEIIGATTSINAINSITNYSELLTSGQREIVDKIYGFLCDDAKKLNLSVIDHVKKCIDMTLYTDKRFTEDTIANMIAKKHPQLNKDDIFIKILIIGSLLYSYCSYGCITQESSNLRKGKTMFDKHNKYSIVDVDKEYNHLNSNINSYYPYINSYVLNFLNKETIKKEFANFNHVAEEKKTASNFILTFTISNNQYDNQHAISEFIKTINNSYKKNTTKTKIHFIKLIEDIKKNDTPNPEYEEYEIKKKLLEQMKDTNPSNLQLFEFLNKPIPPKTLTTETVTKKIECKFLNEMEKDFNTLFLRKDDKEELFTSLDMFKNKGDVLKDMGLQNKYNLLLYGEPGTGKSTTIQAVANYLQKDIYYIDLLKVETNEDLHMIFEYVNKNIPNSGIIIMEDIDAMTDVVLKRTDKLNEYNMNDIMNNQKSKLTLEYFLNILQGTLTIDNSVFIVTTNHIAHLDPAFYRDGRFDVKIELKLCNKYQIGQIYNKMMGKMLPDDILDKVIEDKFSPATIIYHIKKYIFCHDKEPSEIIAPFIQ